MSYNIFVILAIIAGAGLPVQIGLNNFLSKDTSPLFASSISFIVGAIGVIIALFITKTPLPSMSTLISVPKIAWLGGLLGAFYIAASIIAAPKIGVASFLTLVIAAQVIASIIIDHYGLIGFKQNPISIGKIIGVCLVILGAFLVKKL